MAGGVQYLHDAALLCLDQLPEADGLLPIQSSGTANLMLNATEGHLAFCPAASSALSLFDVSASIKGPAWTALGSKLDSESACQGSLVECSWGINSTILLRSQSGALCATNSNGSILWQWPGVSDTERTVAAVWLGQDTVAALTTAGKIYTLPSQTGLPVTEFMRRLTAIHKYFRCMSFDEANSRLIIVGDNGLARKAQTSQQLHAALSVSIWDLSNMRQPVMAGMAGAKQGLFSGTMRASDMQQGWDVAVTSTHLAVILPSHVMATYSLQGSGDHVRITSLHTWGDTPTPDATLSTPQRPLPGDSLLRCSSNAVWWAPDELAFVGPEGCLQIVHVPSGHKVMYVDSQYFLPGSRIVASQGVYGQPRKIYVLSALIQAARPLGRRQKKSTAPTVMRRWMLVGITQLNPQDKLTRLVSQQQWQAALDLAMQHQLSPDDIYKSQWVAEGPGPSGLPGALAHVHDRPWVVQQCLAYMAADGATQQQLLQYGLEITAHHCQPSDLAAAQQGEADSNLEASMWWLLQRVHLLELLDALQTFMAVTNRFDEASYKEFRQHTLEEAAMAAARHASVSKVMVLCERHPHRLVPGMLTLLACLPETVPADSYSQLLTLVSGFDSCAESALQRREADWVEGEGLPALAISMGYPSAACATEHLASSQSHCTPPTSQQVGMWLTERAQVVEEMTGQLHTATRLLRLAQEFDPEEALTRQLSTVASLQDGLQEGAMDGASWGVSLTQFKQLSHHDQVLLLVPEGELGPEAAAATAQRIAKLVGATVDPKQRQQLLAGLVAEDAGRHLPWCTHMFERLRLQRQVFVSRGHMATCAVACAYACSLPHHWVSLLAIVQAGSASLQEQQQLKPDQQELAEQLRKAEGQCRAGQLLGALGLDISLPGLRAATPAAATELLKLLLRQLADSVPPLSESRWVEVSEEVQEAVQAGLPGLSEQEVQAQLCQALLCCAHFNLAKQYLTGGQALPSQMAREVVLEAAQHFFKAASSLEAEEIGLGQVALSLLPHDPDVQQHGMSLKALQELQDYGLYLLPADYNQVEDKMELLRVALERDPKTHNRPAGVKHLASLLGLKGRSNEVMLCIGRAALDHGDLQSAQQTCVQLINRDYVASWRLCADVMRAGGDEVGSKDTHVMLLSFAAQYACGRKLRGVLAHLRHITQGLHHDALSPEQSPSPTTSQSSSPTSSRSHRHPACASPERVQQILRGAVNAPLPLMLDGRPLPGHDDGQMALGSLLSLAEEAWPLLQGMLEQAPSPGHARRALLMGLHASALKVLMAQPAEGSIEEQIQHTRALWHSRPWDLAEQCNQVQPDKLTPEDRLAQEWCKKYGQQLHSQKDTLQIREALPGVNLQHFTGTSAESESFRTEQLSKLASEAGQSEDVALGQASLQRALTLALKYNCPQWNLTFVYANSLLLHWQHSPGSVVPVVRQVFPTLMEQPYATVQQLLLQTWPELQGQRQLHVAFCLKLLEMCFKHTSTTAHQLTGPALDQPEESIHRLQQLQSFCRSMGAAAAGLDIKPFVIPHLPAQLLIIVITQQANAGVGDSVGAEAAVSLDGLQMAAVDELCSHANGSNVQELADLICQLPSLTNLNSAVNSSGVDTSTGRSHVISSSTVYMAAACGLLLESPNLEPNGQTEACQEVGDYLEQLTAEDLTGLLLWSVLQQSHPLLPSGPQLPEELRLSLLQSGLKVLYGQADRDDGMEVDGRLESEASRLSVLCNIQQSCELTEEQQGMVEQALETASVAEDGASHQVPTLEQCIAELVSTGLPVEHLLVVTSSLQSRGQTATASKQAESQAAEVATAVVQRLLSQALPVLSSGSSHTLLHSGLANGHGDGLALGKDQDSLGTLLPVTTADEASACILGLLQSLQSAGNSDQGKHTVAELRQYVWSTLQHHLLSGDSPSLQPAQLQLLEVVLGLSTNSQSADQALSTRMVPSTSSSPEKAKQLAPLHWEGWIPEQRDSDMAQGQHLLLISHTRAVVKGFWPDVEVGSQDVATLAAAQQLFLTLLESGHEVQQLQALHALLLDVWRNGTALPADQGEEQHESQCSPVHACWSALLERMLTAGQAGSVLKALDAAVPPCALLMPDEAHQLVEHSRSLAHQGAAATISLLQSDSALVNSALHELADKAIVHVVKPDLALLAVLLDRGLFDKVAEGLQAQLIKVLSADHNIPPLLSPGYPSPSVPAHEYIDARTIILPATISLLAAQGCYAQAAALCVYHTRFHHAFANFESGMQQLLPYLKGHQEVVTAGGASCDNLHASWPLPQTLIRVQKSLDAMLAASIERMQADNYDNFV